MLTKNETYAESDWPNGLSGQVFVARKDCVTPTARHNVMTRME